MKFIYKYLPAERITYFSDSLLRFTPPSALNDPFECLPGMPEELEKAAYKFFENELSKPPEHFSRLSRKKRLIAEKEFDVKIKNALAKLRQDPDLINELFYAQATSNMDKKIGILSLSKRWNSGLMWSHYTNSHQGFCLGFKADHEYFSTDSVKAKSEDFVIAPVTYSTERPMVPHQKPTKMEAFQILFTKSLDWKYENEVRAVDFLKNAHKIVNMKPFDLSLFQVPHDAIGEIILGLRTNSETRAIVKEFAKDNSIPIYQAKISQKSFDIDRVLASC